MSDLGIEFNPTCQVCPLWLAYKPFSRCIFHEDDSADLLLSLEGSLIKDCKMYPSEKGWSNNGMSPEGYYVNIFFRL